jgi:hypothetical protein
LLDTAAETPGGIVLSVDEIDDDRTDTFRPFVSYKAEAGTATEAFLFQMTFEGEANLQRDCRALCFKYADIFRDTIAALPAQLTPHEITVKKAKWEQPENRGPVRPQSAKKEVEIDKALKEVLLIALFTATLSSYCGL